MLVDLNLEMPWKHQDLKFPFLHNFGIYVYTRRKTPYSNFCHLYHNNNGMVCKIGFWMWSIYTDGSTNGGIFKFETTLVKKLLKVSAILSLFANMDLSSTKVILTDLAFSVNSGLTHFQNDFLSMTYLLIIQINCNSHFLFFE